MPIIFLATYKKKCIVSFNEADRVSFFGILSILLHRLFHERRTKNVLRIGTFVAYFAHLSWYENWPHLWLMQTKWNTFRWIYLSIFIMFWGRQEVVLGFFFAIYHVKNTHSMVFLDIPQLHFFASSDTKEVKNENTKHKSSKTMRGSDLSFL